MEQYKHKCDFAFCNIHGQCMFKNAVSEIKSNAYIVSLQSSGDVFCYQKETLVQDIKVKIKEEKIVEREIKETYSSPYLSNEKYHQPHCQNPKCKSVADTKFNGEINLCFKCVDLLREWKTNYELGTIFRKIDKLLKLFKIIDEHTREANKVMLRCSNIYCGTLDKITKHHLIPKPFRNKQTVEKIPLCEDCHKKVHQLATNTELANIYNTKQSVIELLAKDVTFRVQKMMSTSSYADSLVSA